MREQTRGGKKEVRKR